MVNNPKIPCLFSRGQWHVPDYQGIQIRSGSVSENYQTLARSAKVTSQAQLSLLQASGAAQMQQIQSHMDHMGELFHTPVPESLPRPTASIADQPALLAPSTALQNQIQSGA